MNLKRWIASILIVMLVITTLGFIKFNQIQAAIAFGESFPEPSASVKSSYVENIDYQQTTQIIGQLQALKAVAIRNEYSGLIVNVNYQPGDIVEKGQVLIEQDTTVERANLAAANARLTLANSTYSRLSKLLQQKRVSPDKVDQAQADVAIAKAEIANLTAIIDKKVIKAPYTGQTGLTQFHVGQLLDMNTHLTDLIATDDTIWVDFKLPQTLPQLTLQDKITVNVINTGDNTPSAFTAHVIAKSAAIDVNSRQITYRAELNNQQHLFHHNQIVSVNVLGKSTQVVAVPTNAITRNHLGAFVFTLQQDTDKNWRAKSTLVELGERQGDLHIIKQGLEGHEFIATEGAFKLKDQLLVYTQVPEQAVQGE